MGVNVGGTDRRVARGNVGVERWRSWLSALGHLASSKHWGGWLGCDSGNLAGSKRWRTWLRRSSGHSAGPQLWGTGWGVAQSM
uniref:Uncharacterized protein n=1 Tax=Bracon brevicornis TaxID=1563983 RepID=A0A6V7KZV3_9HYME